MQEEELTTIKRIHDTAKEEFLQKGFQSASLRNIVKKAGVTTGAFYGYYKSKEELFDALVKDGFDTFIGMYKKAQDDFTRLSPEEQLKNMGKISGECLQDMLKFAYENRDVFHLLLCSAEGTRYENMEHEMVEIEIEATHTFVNATKGVVNCEYNIDKALEHILVSGLFTAFFEMIIHDVPYEKATEYLEKLREFYTAGWQKIMGF